MGHDMWGWGGMWFGWLFWLIIIAVPEIAALDDPVFSSGSIGLERGASGTQLTNSRIESTTKRILNTRWFMFISSTEFNRHGK